MGDVIQFDAATRKAREHLERAKRIDRQATQGVIGTLLELMQSRNEQEKLRRSVARVIECYAAAWPPEAIEHAIQTAHRALDEGNPACTALSLALGKDWTTE